MKMQWTVCCKGLGNIVRTSGEHEGVDQCGWYKQGGNEHGEGQQRNLNTLEKDLDEMDVDAKENLPSMSDIGTIEGEFAELSYSALAPYFVTSNTNDPNVAK